MKRTGIMVMVLALGLSAAPAVAVNVTLSDAGLMLLDRYIEVPGTSTIVDRREVPGPGVEFDIYFSVVEPGSATVYCVSWEGHGAGSLAGIDVSMYDAFELKFTLLAVDGINTPGIGGTLIVGALIGPYDGSGHAFQPQGLDFLPDTHYGTTAISSTPVRTNRISIIGLIAYIPSSMEGGWNPSGTTVTLLVEAAPGAVAIPEPATIYVDADASGNNDGSSWSEAFNDLQDALAAAWSGDEIRVAEGIYKPDEDSAHPDGTGERTATFQLKNGVTIRGGYAGFGESEPNARDIDVYETILSGDLAGDDGPDFTNNSENSYHVVTGSGTDATTVLDGFTISGGYADGFTFSNCRGGGMYNSGSCRPTLANCTFSGNSASESGGGMYNEYSNPTLINCTFSGNSAGSDGGGMLNIRSDPVLTNCTFSGNSANRHGGGMFNMRSDPVLTNCILWGDTPNEIYNIESTAIITYSDVQGGWPGEGNINANPLFVDSAIGDYHLLPDSPCIDAGDNSAVPPSVLTDLDGKPRIINGTVNMGAYEFHYLRILYVDADAAGVNDGSSWADAYNELQDALAVAWSGDEIRVAQGTYKPDKGGGNTSGDRLATFQLKNGVAIKGGYAGFGQPDPNARDIEAYETILSGDLHGNDIQVINPEDLPEQPSRAENSYRVVTGSGCNQTAVLDGFTITAGNANGEYPLWEYARGAGMYNEYGNPTVRNCTFSANSAEDNGAGMLNWESNPAITDCNFRSNYARSHGGGMSNQYSSPTLVNCTFSGNAANTYGGGMDNMFGSDPNLTNCTFTRNSATSSGSYGGGMYSHWSNPTLNNCIFSSNSANRWGGGMFNWDNTATLTNCIFSGNSAGIWGGGICNWGDGNPILTSCMFTGNAANDGGAIYNNGTTEPVLINCTFAVNSAIHGSALACDSPEQEHPSNVQMLNCILWDGSDGIFNNDNSTITITYSDVRGGWPGEGNIDADPRFGVPGSWKLIKGMDSHWKFDGNAYDSAGGNDGTVYGNPVWTIGQLGGALDLDGAGDYVNCGNDSSLNLTNNFSISAWLNLDNAGPEILLCKGNVPAYFAGGAYTILCVPSNGTLSFYVRGSNNAEYGYAVTAVAINEWTHIVGTFNDGNISIYKNGVFVANGILGTSTINTNNGPLGIGAEGDGGMPFKGTIDDVAIHNRALSREEIQQLYQIGLSGHSYYHLLPVSPCINAGDPNYVAEPNETDLDGNPRVIGGRIDMGAYEYPNTAPVADAGDDQTVECACNTQQGTKVTLDGTGSYDTDGDLLTYTWTGPFDESPANGPTPTVTLDSGCPGEYVITLVVNDGIDESEPNDVVITVVDTTPPVITCPPDVTLECPADTSPSATGKATATDTCGTATIRSRNRIIPGCGNTETIERTWIATDEYENSSSCVQTITVVDTTPPEFEFSVSPRILWPPNHKMELITPSWTLSDECDATPDVSLVSIVANEGDDTIGDGHTTDDIQTGDDGSIYLRAERSGTSNDRVYTITYQAVDDCGNATVGRATVSIPHDFKVLARIAARWLWTGPAGRIPEDLNGDGAINFTDFARFAENWIK